ncbi:MAG: hypothetical protein IJ008_03380 [Clostridia bacterium]|nr:hypothetical protein [Clostridia bacterium]
MPTQKKQTIKESGTWIDVVLVNILFLAICFLVSFMPVLNLLLVFVAMVYLEIGVWGYVLKRQQNEKIRYEDIFIKPNLFLKSVCVKIIKIFIIALWSLVFIIPGVIMMLNYSFTGLITYEGKDIDSKGILQLSHELTYGYKFKIFLAFMISLLSVCVAVSIPFGILKIINIFTFIHWWIYVVVICMFAILSGILIALPLFQLSLTDYYIQAKNKSKIRKEKVK